MGKFSNLDINGKIDNIFTSLDFAIKYSIVFNYDYSGKKYSVQSGNKEIFMQMIWEGKTFDNMINTTLCYRNYVTAEHLKSNLA